MNGCDDEVFRFKEYVNNWFKEAYNHPANIQQDNIHKDTEGVIATERYRDTMATHAHKEGTALLRMSAADSHLYSVHSAPLVCIGNESKI